MKMDTPNDDQDAQGTSDRDEKPFVAVPCQQVETDLSNNEEIDTVRVRHPTGPSPNGVQRDRKTESKKNSIQKSVTRREKDPQDEDFESFSTPPPKKRKSPPSSSAKRIPSFHPRSKWQEPDREDDLTLYEWYRTPRPVLSGRIERPADSVLQCFRCAICLETIRKAVVVECLHRFCEECMERALSMGSGQCPICRVAIPSRRKLFRDRGFDSLTRAVVGEIGFELVNDNSTLTAASLQKVILRKQTEQSKKSPTIPLSSRSETDTAGGLNNGSSVIDFALFRYECNGLHNQLDPLNLPYIRTQDTATVQVIKLFLKRKLNLEPHLKLQLLSVDVDSRKHVLADSLSLASIASTASHDSEMLELFYRLEPKRGIRSKEKKSEMILQNGE